MLKKITEPQALYHKDHPNKGEMPEGSAPKKNPKDTKRSLKIAAGALAAVLFLVVGVAGVLVSQRQRQVAGPVAPNAPSSQPLAAGNAIPEENPAVACSLSFTVEGTPPPTTPPPAGTAQCTSKIALLVKADGSLEALPANTAVKPNSVIEYQVPVTATNATKGTVKLEDTLGANTTFLAAKDQPATDGTVTASGNKVSITLPAFTAANQKKLVKYRVRVGTTAQPYTFVNTVKVADNGNGAAGQNCSISLKTIPTGVASCVTKTAYQLDASNKKINLADKGTVLRGTEYFYSITVQATGKTTGAVTVKDTLPTGISFVEDAKNTAGVTAAQVSGKTVVTATMPATFGEKATEAKPEEAVIQFKVKIAESVNPGTFKNTVAVTTGTTTSQDTCDHTLEVKPDGVAACVSKEMHNAAISSGKADTETRISENTNLDKNSEFYYRVKVSSARQTTGKVTITDSIPAALEVVDAGNFTLENGKYVASYDAFSGEKVAELKVKVKDGYQSEVVNSITVTTAGSSNSDSSCVSKFNIPTYACNSGCDNDDQCKQASSDYSCVSTSEGKRCRMTANQDSTSCQLASTPTPTPTTVVSTPSPTPTVGCNSVCSTNSDCANTAHICYQTADGGRCRLDSNVNSTSCSAPIAQATPAPTAQPQLPEELPQTGPEDWGNWLKAGLVTLGIGAVLLLLL